MTISVSHPENKKSIISTCKFLQDETSGYFTISLTFTELRIQNIYYLLRDMYVEIFIRTCCYIESICFLNQS